MLIRVINSVFWVITHLFWSGCMLTAMTSPGALLLRKVTFHSRTERWVFTLALGAGSAALFLFALGVTGFLTREIIQAGTFIGCLITIIRYGRQPRQLWKERYAAFQTAYRQNKLFVFFAGCYWLLLLLTTQYPPMNWDATMYHLVLSRNYLNDGQILLQPGMIFPVLPLLNHMLFAWALALHDDILAQMMTHLFLMLVALGLYAWGQRQSSRWLGLTAAAFWLAHPLILWLAESAYVDLGVTCFAFLGVYALRIFQDNNTKEWWWIGLALLCYAAGSKLPGLVFLACALVMGIAAWWRSRLISRELILSGLLVLLLVSPWYVLIARFAGNPLWPLFAQFSPGLWGDSSVIASMNNWIENVGIPKTLTNFLLLPFYMAVQPASFLPDNHLPLFPIIGAWMLAWAVAWWNRSVRWWSVWALVFTAFWFLSSQQLRLWTPAVPLAGLALCESVQWVAGYIALLKRHARFFCLIFVSGALLFGGLAAGARLYGKGWPPVEMAEREALLRNAWGHYAAVEFVNKNLTGNEAVYVINCSWVNYYFRTRVVDASGLLQLALQPQYQWPADERWIRWLENQQVGWIMVNAQSLPPIWLSGGQNPALQPVWPGWKLVFADSHAWVFQHAPSSAR